MKIHDANEDIVKQDKERKEKRSKLQDIENKFHPYETLSQVIQNKYNPTPQSKFTVRLESDLETKLRIYAEEKGLTVPSSIRHICENYFHERWIARSFFKLEKPFTVAIPITPYELEKYVKDGINCMIDLTSDINSRLDVQSQLISKDETDYYLAVTFNVGNNYLDIYDKEKESYCFGTIQDHHLGLYDIHLEHLKESIFIRVLFQDKSPISARIISKDEAIQNAINTNNKMLEQYIKNIQQAIDVKDYNESIRDREQYIKTLEARILSLENELSEIKEENKDINEQLAEMQDDSEDETSQRDPTQTVSMIPAETQKSIINAMMQMRETNQRLNKQLEPIMKMMLDAQIKTRQITNDNKENKSADMIEENESDNVNDE